VRKIKLKKNNSESRQRVIQIQFNPNVEQIIILDCLTYAASKLWNVANYERKRWTKESRVPYPDWYDQKKMLKDNFWYKNLPSQSAQELLKQLHEAWKSFYKLQKTGGIKNPQPPRYKQNNIGIRFLNKGFTISRGIIRLAVPKHQKEYILQKYNQDVDFLYIRIPDEYINFTGNPKIIEIIPLEKNKYRVNIIVELPEVAMNQDNGIYMAVDLGVNNLITCYCSTGKSLIISGRQLLTINRYFDKTISKYQSISDAQQSAKGIKYLKKSKRVLELYEKRRKQVKHLIHTATRQAIDFAVKEDVSKIIIGDITHIRVDNNMGKVNNQKFHRLPYKQIIGQITYKGIDKGILVKMQEESYTSQCSPYSSEVSKDTAEKKNRKYRGLYVVDKKLFNADCVGAYNILRKYLQRIGNQPITAVVGLDTPEMYRWDSIRGFFSNSKLAISMTK